MNPVSPRFFHAALLLLLGLASVLLPMRSAAQGIRTVGIDEPGTLGPGTGLALLEATPIYRDNGVRDAQLIVPCVAAGYAYTFGSQLSVVELGVEVQSDRWIRSGTHPVGLEGAQAVGVDDATNSFYIAQDSPPMLHKYRADGPGSLPKYIGAIDLPDYDYAPKGIGQIPLAISPDNDSMAIGFQRRTVSDDRQSAGVILIELGTGDTLPEIQAIKFFERNVAWVLGVGIDSENRDVFVATTPIASQIWIESLDRNAPFIPWRVFKFRYQNGGLSAAGYLQGKIFGSPTAPMNLHIDAAGGYGIAASYPSGVLRKFSLGDDATPPAIIWETRESISYRPFATYLDVKSDVLFYSQGNFVMRAFVGGTSDQFAWDSAVFANPTEHAEDRDAANAPQPAVAIAQIPNTDLGWTAKGGQTAYFLQGLGQSMPLGRNLRSSYPELPPPFTPMAAVALSHDGTQLFTATDSAPAFVERLAMTPSTPGAAVSGELALGAGDVFPRVLGHDHTSGTLYVATNTSPARLVKIDVANPSAPLREIASISLGAENDMAASLAIDPVARRAYIGMFTAPGRIAIVDLGQGEQAPVVLDTMTLQPGENFVRTLLLDSSSRRLIAGLVTSPGRVVTLAIDQDDGSLERERSMTLDAGEDFIAAGAVDRERGIAVLSLYTNPIKLVTLNWGNAVIPISRRDALTLDANDGNNALTVALDVARGLAYTGSSLPGADWIECSYASDSGGLSRRRSLPHVLRIDNPGVLAGIWDVQRDRLLGFRVGDPTFVEAFSNVVAESGIDAASSNHVGSKSQNIVSTAYSASRRTLYLLVDAPVDELVTMMAGEGAAPPTIVGRRLAAMDGSNGKSLALDELNSSLYVMTDKSLFKFRVDNATNEPVPVGQTPLNPSEDLNLVHAVVHPTRGVAVFASGSGVVPPSATKFKLHPGDQLPTRYGSRANASVNAAYNSLEFDSVRGRAIASAGGFPPQIATLDLFDNGESPLGQVISLAAPEAGGMALVVDASHHDAHLLVRQPNSTWTRYSRIELANAGGSMEQLAGLDYVTNGLPAQSRAVVDPVRQLAYVLLGAMDIGSVACLRYDMSVAGPLAKAGTLNTSLRKPAPLVFDRERLELYGVSNHDADGSILYRWNAGADQLGTLYARQVTLTEDAVVADVNMYSHRANGQVILSIYDDQSPRNLLWTTPAMPNTAKNDWIVAEIEDGSPKNLTLPPGNYYLALQSDSSWPVRSYSGWEADGFQRVQPFGTPPATLAPGEYVQRGMNDVIYMTYNPAP